MDIQYIAHISEDGKRKQSIRDHLKQTAELAREFGQDSEVGDMAYISAKSHDIGKYAKEFQQYIRGERKGRVDHSTAGAQLLFSKRKTYAGFSIIGAFCVAGHHAGIPNLGSQVSEDTSGNLWGRMKKKIPDYSAYREEMTLPETVDSHMVQTVGKDTVGAMLLTRMVFSSLVDADFLNTEKFMSDDQVVREPFASIPVLERKFFDKLREKGYMNPTNSINQKRFEILQASITAGEKKPGIYTMTVPTGGGKTISSLAFAFKHAAAWKKKRIIYVIPYLSIIEQTAEIFRDFLGKENVLESHSNVTYDDEGLGSDQDPSIQQKKLAAENWDASIVVTTSEQFWESLFSNRTSKCRKLHNIANSVIVFDEVQMFPVEFLDPCLKALEALVKYFHCSAVLCSATQPHLEKYLSLPTTEIMDHIPELYDFFRRVRYVDDSIMTYEEIGDKLNQEHQVLCIASTKKEARNIYAQLHDEEALYLSTNLCPIHRKKVIRSIRKRLKSGQVCQVVSTSIISVGVDVDFPVAYLEKTGSDGLIQGAGRCNREGKRSIDNSVVHIFQTENSKKSRFMKREREITDVILRKMGDISTPESIKSYFDQFYLALGTSRDKKEVLKKAEDWAFADIGREFHLIEDQTKSLFIPYDTQAEALAEKLKQGIRTRDLLRQASAYIVNVRYDSKQESPFSKLLGDGYAAMFPNDTEMAFLTNMDLYDEKLGLVIPEEEGAAIQW